MEPVVRWQLFAALLRIRIQIAVRAIRVALADNRLAVSYRAIRFLALPLKISTSVYRLQNTKQRSAMRIVATRSWN